MLDEREAMLDEREAMFDEREAICVPMHFKVTATFRFGCDNLGFLAGRRLSSITYICDSLINSLTLCFAASSAVAYRLF